MSNFYALEKCPKQSIKNLKSTTNEQHCKFVYCNNIIFNEIVNY